MYRGATDSNIKIVTSGLIFHLDAAQLRSYTGSGTTWSDLSGNNFNSTLTNGPSFLNDNGGCISFDGVNDYVSRAMSSTLRPTTITLEGWVRKTSIVNHQVYIFGLQSGTGTVKSYALYYFDGRLAMNINNNLAIRGGGAISSNVWYHFVGTYDLSAIRTYADGVLEATTVYSTAISYDTNNTELTMGSTYDGTGYQVGNARFWDGSMAILRIYNRALTATEILQNYNANRTRFGK
jgi:hypothetical protein